jgi:DNA repair protein RadC
MGMKIKDLPANERPRERLINYGAYLLSNEELLAIILKTGSKGESAKVLASRIISSVSEISKLKELKYHQINNIRGIGPSKATALLAAVELGSRIEKPKTIIENIKITNSKSVHEYFKDIFAGAKQEYFYCLYLNNSKIVLQNKLLFIGTLNYSVVHPREIFKEAYLLSAQSIICVHNHPSGSLEPSNEDKLLTERLVEIGKIFGINVIDHIIVAESGYYSFYENDGI